MKINKNDNKIFYSSHEDSMCLSVLGFCSLYSYIIEKYWNDKLLLSTRTVGQVAGALRVVTPLYSKFFIIAIGIKVRLSSSSVYKETSSSVCKYVLNLFSRSQKDN